MNRKIRLIAGLTGCLALLQAAPAGAQEAEKLTLRGAVTLALQNSRELALARVQYTVASNLAGVDRAAFHPNLYTGSTPAYSSGFPETPGGAAPSIFSMSYTQALFNPLLKEQQHAAEERAKSRKLEVDRIHDDIIVRTATTYLELAKVRHSLELLRNEEASAEKILGVTRERAAAGQELPVEITRGELTLARIRERVIKLEGRDEILLQQLQNLTGVAEERFIEVETEEPSFATDQQESELVKLALDNDPGIQEAERERAARQHILRGTRLSYLPTVDAIAKYSVLAKFNNYSEFFRQFQRNNVNVGVMITVPLFSAKTAANVSLAKSQLNEAEIMLGNKRQQVSLEARQKARNVRELEAGREVARLDLKLAQETLQMVQAKFDEGRATLRDIEQARLDESDKWVAFLDADFARQQGQLTLLQATGQLAKVFQ
jgi:outer membrane protein TolC